MFAQKLHKGLSRLRLPLEYMAICALCAKDPVKERRAHARQCLVKNITVRREYLKQHAAVSGECRGGGGGVGAWGAKCTFQSARCGLIEQNTLQLFFIIQVYTSLKSQPLSIATFHLLHLNIYV